MFKGKLLTSRKGFVFFLVFTGLTVIACNQLQRQSRRPNRPAVYDKYIIVTHYGKTSVALRWNAAFSRSTWKRNLQYCVYYSKNAHMDTVAQIERNGKPAMPYKKGITKYTIILRRSI